MIEFVNASQFLKGVDGVAPSTDEEIEPGIYVPKQDADIETLVVSQAVVAVILLNIVLSSIQSSSMQSLFGSISSLSLIVHIPINFENMHFPSTASTVFGALIQAVTFDVLESLGSLGFSLPYEVSSTDSYNDGFDTLGYDSREPIGLLGTINFILAITIARTLIFLLVRITCKDRCGMRKRMEKHTNGII